MKIISIIFLMISFLCISCKKDNPYTYSKEQSLKIQTAYPGETVVDSFGSEGPYKKTGSIQSNSNRPVSFHVVVKDEEIIKKYPAEERTSYISHNYENEAGDGFMVISKFTENK